MKRSTSRAKGRNRTAFTLVEVLIVVVIMAVLAATIIPQFTNSTNDAKDSTVLFNLHSMRSLIELYKSQHNGTAPGADLKELTSATDRAGNIGTGASYPYGPYLQKIPVNPFTDSNTVAQPTSVPPTATVSGAGWLYDPTTGQIWINHADYLSE